MRVHFCFIAEKTEFFLIKTVLTSYFPSPTQKELRRKPAACPVFFFVVVVVVCLFFMVVVGFPH